MKYSNLFLITCLLFLLSFIGYRPTADDSNAGSPTLKQIGSIDLPGTPGKRFDYLIIDYKRNFLLSAHLGADVTYVVNLKSNKLVKMITNTPGVEGLELVSDLNKVYTSNWGDHTVGVIDMNRMEVVKKIPVINKPDGSAYATGFKKIYVSDERGKTLVVIDVKKDEVIKKIPFESETGMPQYDSVSKKIYLNLQDKNIFVVIDPLTDNVIGEYAVGECKGNHGMALDVKNRLAFLHCENNDLLTVFDLETYKPVSFLKCAPGGDVVKFDPGNKRIYVACYSGAISVFHEDDLTHVTKLEDFKVQKKIHSLGVDEKTHRVYAPEQEADGKPVSRMIIYEAIN